MSQARPVRPLLLGLLAVLCAAGCGQQLEGEQPPAPPTDAELSRFVTETRQPAYWLGPRLRGIEVSHASVDGWGVRLTYGPWTCDTGCTDSGGVTTRHRSMDLLSPDSGGPVIASKKCWLRVKKAVAVLVGCDPAGYPQELLVFSGAHEILVTSLYTPDGQDEIPVRTVVRALRPLNGSATWPLPQPAPLSCHELSQIDRRYGQHLPRLLRPRGEC